MLVACEELAKGGGAGARPAVAAEKGERNATRQRPLDSGWMAGLGRQARLRHLVRITSGSSRSARLTAVTGRVLRRRVGVGRGACQREESALSVCARTLRMEDGSDGLWVGRDLQAEVDCILGPPNQRYY